jgi:two-component system, OmpR family, response regulator RegX3
MTAPDPVVLIVEDEESYVEALEVGLRREGFVTKVARNGPDALALFEVVRPDLVLLDLMLPGMSGVDVCSRSGSCPARPSSW